MATTLVLPSRTLRTPAEKVVDGSGLTWCFTDIEGWASGPPVLITANERGVSDGALITRYRRQARYYGIEGFVICPNEAGLFQARDSIAAMFHQMAPGLMQVTEPTNPKQATVYLSEEVDVTKRASTLFFSAALMALDPRRYSTGASAPVATIPANSTSGGVTATNNGTAPSPPIITIVGPAVNPIVRNNTTGEQINLGVTLTSGQSLELNFQERRITIGGVDRGDVWSSGIWWLVAAGANSITYSVTGTSTANSTATISFRSAWF